MRSGEAAGVRPRPHLLLQKPAAHERLCPQRCRRKPVVSQELRERDERVEVDHRSPLSAASSSTNLASGATGARGGGSSCTVTGAERHPRRMASASTASDANGPRPCGGHSSATARSRSVTRTVSPPLTSRMYSLGPVLQELEPDCPPGQKVASGSYLRNAQPDPRLPRAPGRIRVVWLFQMGAP